MSAYAARSNYRLKDRPVVSDPAVAVREIAAEYPDGDPRERFAVVILDVRHAIIGTALISIGSVSASVVHPREVFRPAIELSASAVLLVHNHPTGNPEPSAEDRAVTRHLAQAGDLLGIKVLDHLIITGSGEWYSMRAGGDFN